MPRFVSSPRPPSPPAKSQKCRRSFASTEQRSYPAGREGGTRLHVTVDTTHPSETIDSDATWLVTSKSGAGDAPHPDEV
ncbi:hypothetical protein [Streptomyces sp. NBC_00885]|uniref:hypothetical protein n=1 Tax=Streptomyces sp. NBC_00885 TaxID=2975857 RepID=UPI00386D0C8B